MAQKKVETDICETKDKKSITTLRYPTSDMNRYRDHAKAEGLSFAKMIQIFFEQDISDKEEAHHDNPGKIIERIRLRKERLSLASKGRFTRLKIDDLIDFKDEEK